MSLRSGAQKGAMAFLKAVPFFGDGLAIPDAMDAVESGAKDRQWKTLQAGVGVAGSLTLLTGAYLNGFHHPAEATVAFVAGLGTHFLAGAAEFAPEKMRAPFVRAVERGLDHVCPRRHAHSL